MTSFPVRWYVPPPSKAERRRQARGVSFPGRSRVTDPWAITILGAKVYATLPDGSAWRLYVRGGKTYRRRLKAGCPTMPDPRTIDPGAFYAGQNLINALEDAQIAGIGAAQTLIGKALAKP